MTKRTVRTKLEVSGEMDRLLDQGVKEQWTALEFFERVYMPIIIKRQYNKYIDSYLHGYNDARMHIIWHTMMNPISMTGPVTWKGTNKLFCEAAE